MTYHNFQTLFLILAFGTFYGCSSFKVVSDVDSTEDFTEFKTFQFAGWAEDKTEKVITLVADLDSLKNLNELAAALVI